MPFELIGQLTKKNMKAWIALYEGVQKNNTLSAEIPEKAQAPEGLYMKRKNQGVCMVWVVNS